MSVLIETDLFPLRFSLKVKEPSDLKVKVTNKGSSERLLSLELFLPPELGFDKSALNKGVRSQLGSLKPGESKELKFRVFLNPPVAKEGNFIGEAKVFEHYKDYKQILRDYRKEISFRIV
ncbi:hypothetical protein HZB89_02305 [archaeon]|nr:hypothetical protein [archaeon]